MYLKLVPSTQAHDGPEIYHMLEISEYFARRLWLKKPDDLHKMTPYPEDYWSPFEFSVPAAETPAPDDTAFIPHGVLLIDATLMHPRADGTLNLALWLQNGFAFIMNDKGDTIERLGPPAWPPESDPNN